ncbi:unnamed protein product [Rotaria magnacalcarata]|uniref:POU domain protein n=2 Tax=Rotaria magnacalcarata TaxID=392030 RepID=A0A816ZUT6_9BILA|nr:unnamed protein product [Rotaria magnacalcarata]CAF1549217.1 unnamed protein product [Rotaria magnacalcarata]CAF2058521.1 unnamed protein product [Rotaria magnacalcarata]CAF2214738.1 unnamed protein product [Rotaria magnacalcarata]CAF2253056.1 unnamed protein product [Rotaria magnacalcarata]
MLTSTSSLEQSSSIMSNNKLSFPNTSNSFTSSQAATSINANSNSIGNNNGRYSSSNFYRAAAVAAVTGDPNNRRYMPSTPWSKSNCFGDSFKFEPNSLFGPTIDDNFLRQAEALAKPETSSSSSLYYASPFACSSGTATASSSSSSSSSSAAIYPGSSSLESHLPSDQIQHNHHPQLNSDLHPFYQHPYATVAHHHAAAAAGVFPGMVVGMHHHHSVHHNNVVGGFLPPHELDIDPRELESFAERFKQRRIKLGVTQADVGQQLSKLKMPGVGSLSQSTICRFESLTLSHNNMVALKPVLQAWLEFAEAEMRQRKKEEMNGSIGSSSGHGSSNGSLIDKKRKRTSIAAQEKRFLESCFLQQQRPSGERIAQIADKLDLKKNVVRVWFCNQRQKNKRLRFAAGQST